MVLTGLLTEVWYNEPNPENRHFQHTVDSFKELMATFIRYKRLHVHPSLFSTRKSISVFIVVVYSALFCLYFEYLLNNIKCKFTVLKLL